MVDSITLPRGTPATVSIKPSAIRATWEVLVARNGTEKVIGQGPPGVEASFTAADIPPGEGPAVLMWYLGVYAPPGMALDYQVSLTFASEGTALHAPVTYKGNLPEASFRALMDHFTINLA